MKHVFDYEEVRSGRIIYYTAQTAPPPDAVLQHYALSYAASFNESPWDVYGWSNDPRQAAREFRTIIAAVIKTGGTFLSFEASPDIPDETKSGPPIAGNPAGFLILSDLSIFNRRLKEVEEFRSLPRDFKNPRTYLELLSRQIEEPLSAFEEVAYLADIVIEPAFRSKGYAGKLTQAAIRYARDCGMKLILAWTVNPLSARILERSGFKLLQGIGEQGEGIDFLIRGRTWYPVLAIPVRAKVPASGAPVRARHYLKMLKA